VRSATRETRRVSHSGIMERSGQRNVNGACGLSNQREAQHGAQETVNESESTIAAQADVLGDGISSVELIQVMGSDEMIAAAARVSYAKDTSPMPVNPLSERGQSNAKLIRYMIDHEHGSPFEHTLITFRVTAPLFVVQEMLRHRIGVSFNQQSGRFTEFKPEFYTPKVFRQQATKNKQSSEGEVKYAGLTRNVYQMANLAAYESYQSLLRLGVCREQARGVLPHCTYTSLYITFNVRSLMHFLDLRLSPDAQWEIMQYAREFARHFEQFFPLTHRAWMEKRLAEDGG